MQDPGTSAKLRVRSAVEKALVDAAATNELPKAENISFIVEIPKDTSKGDLACNVAMSSAGLFRMSPMKISEVLLKYLHSNNDGFFERIEAVPPGFINFFFGDSFYFSSLKDILTQNENYGKTDFGCNKKYMVEFVSANPTGPMHLGNARGGALGDCLASLLQVAGYDVCREFYVNDAGSQIDKFASSLEARYLEIYDKTAVFPEDGYQGEDITEHAANFAYIYGDKYVTASPEERKKALVDYALPLNLEYMKSILSDYRIVYDNWFLESSLHKSRTVDKVIGILRERDALYEKDGALWYKATDFGLEKDEVLVRKNGFATYFAVDIAYHYNKFIEREFDTVTDVWGADHHGHVARLKSAMKALGIDSDKLNIVINQMVNLIRDGENVRMSKRTGKVITLSTLLDEIPVDAARFFFNLREPTSHLDFDLDLASKQSSDNPVYYVQYAHARICSILTGLTANGIDIDSSLSSDFTVLRTEEERSLIRHLCYFPGEIITAITEFNPARITRYTIELATLFHKFYTNCRVKGEDDSIMYPRIALCIASKQVIKNCLQLLKITAPESM